MPEFVNYQLQQIPIRQIDTNLVGNTLATITAGNKEALQKQSELRTAIANMDLNEAEDGFRQQLFDDITTTIEDNSIAGNAYYALDDIIKKAGDIGSNPGLIGRLKAQQAYKQFQAEVDARKDLNDDTKAWAKAKNPYRYQDKVDKTGRVIGGTEWKPNITPVEDIDMNKVYALASQYIRPKKSNWESTTFVDENGNVSKTYKPGYFVLNEITGKKEEVTREMVDNAINMAINADPEIEASMKQSFEVAKWKHSNGDTDNNLAYDSTGKLKSYNQYRNDLIDPYINQMVYSETQSSTKWNNSGLQLMYKQQAKERLAQQTNGLGITSENAVRNATSVMGNPIELDKDIFGSSLGKINQGKAQLANIIGRGIDEIPDTYEDFINLCKSVKLNEDAEDEKGNLLNSVKRIAKDFYDIYGTQIQNNNNRKNSNSELDAATVVEQYLQQNIPLNQIDGTNPYLTKYIEEYNSFIDNLFNGAETISFKPKDINKILTSKEQKQRIEDLGMKIENNSIVLDKNDDNAAYTFANLIKGQKGDFYRDGEKITPFLKIAYGDTMFGDSINSPSDIVNRANNLNNMINAAYQDAKVQRVENDNNKIAVGTGSLSTFTIGDTWAQQILEETGEAKVKSMRDAAKSRALNAFRTGTFVDNEIYQATPIFDKQGNLISYNYKELNRADKLKIANEFAGVKDADVTGNLSYIQGYEFKQGFVYPHKVYDKEGKDTHTTKEVKLIFGTNQNDPALETLNNMDFIRAGKELMGSYINEESVNIGKLNDDYITVKGIKDPTNAKFSDIFEVDLGGDYLGRCDITTAMSLLQSYRTLVYDRRNFNPGSNIEESISDYVKENPNIYANYVALVGEEQAFNIISSILLNY